MTDVNWQKSTYSEEGSSCVYLATAPDGTIRLRESDEPDVIATVSPSQLRQLIAVIRDAGPWADRGSPQRGARQPTIATGASHASRSTVIV